MKKICVITTAHPAEDNRIYLKEVRTLLERYKVVYITTGAVANLPKNLGLINVGYFGGSFKKRLSINWVAFKNALNLDVSSYHFHDFDFILYAVLLKILKGKPIFYDVHEDYPAVVESRGYIKNKVIAKFASWFVQAVEMFCSLFFTGAFVVNHSIERRIKHVIAKTKVVANYPRTDYFPKKSDSKDDGAEVKIVHLGNLNKIRGAEIIFDALNSLKKGTASLTVVGEITPKGYEEDLVARYPEVSPNVTGKLPYEKALVTAQAGNVGIIGYLPVPNHVDASPNKIFEYMGLELPVLGSDLEPFKKVLSGGAGIIYKAEEPKSLKSSILKLADPKERKLMAAIGRNLFENRYNWDKEGVKLLELYEEVIGK